MEIARALGAAHPLLVHFPIVLLLLSVVLDVMGWQKKDPNLALCGYWLMLLGTGGALVAFVCGILAELSAARQGAPQTPIEAHELLATVATWLFLGLAVTRILLGPRLKGRIGKTWLWAGVVGCVLLAAAAHLGGRAAYNYGANVGGVQLQRMLTDEDLATLAQHQDESTLQYSNQMHWIFGGIVIALALSVFLERLPCGVGLPWGPLLDRLRMLRRLMPFVFMGGGVYLAIYSDWDSWPLSNLRPIYDSEVLLHKFIALLLMFMGAASLRKPKDDNVAPNVWQNRVIAVMAAIGGGLLFTHVHTNAPYSNAAVGVYLNHLALGIVALLLAGILLAADRLPDSRLVSMLFPTLLLVEGLLLASYNEDLPWFAGYNRILNKPAHGGLLAHVHGGRAELVFHSTDGSMDVYLMHAHDAEVMPLNAATLRGVIEAGQHRFPIEFERKNVGLYFARMPWLRRMPLFSLHLDAPLVADFEPVITAPLLPPLAGAERVYACPMCVDVRSSIPGFCPMCGMALAPLPTPEIYPPRLPAHDAEYTMGLDVEPSPPQAGRRTRLRFTMRGTDGSVVRDLRLQHEKLLHLVMVSDDLRWFAHVHPQLQGDGSLTLDYVFPHGGRFVLFAEAAPQGHRSQRFRLPLKVDGPPQVPVAAQFRSADRVQQIGDYTVALDTDDLGLWAGWENQLTFTIFKQGHPVDDLGAYLGALGHCVIISEDTQDFVHCHAIQMSAVKLPGGPQVAFHALFPRAGRYHVWAQFSHQGHLLTADFPLTVY